MMFVTLQNEGGTDTLIHELAERARIEGGQARVAKTQGARRSARDRQMAFLQSLELADVVIRCENSGSPVQMRNAAEILADHEIDIGPLP